ncbi:MAG: hypothetical protein MI723_08805 [Caulobacterales bacterium]|nr:hypothetical protein [Caulobacterales bacterium]
MIPRAFLPLLGALAMAACATQTPYAPADESRSGYGYSETQLENDRYRVSFSGNSLTDLDTVENYLLFRAAELTLQTGGDWFEIIDRTTESKSRLVGTTTSHPFHYRFYHPRRGFYYYDPFFHGGFSSTTLREVTRYEIFAEIVVGEGDTPDEPRAYSAREVDRNLRNTIAYPQP